jgi:hypothetical protein
VPADRIVVEGDCFRDAVGRQVMLRGVNLGGDCKVPYPGGGTNHPTDFSDHREVSFIGRPFPLAEADEHFARLRRWGFNCLRLLTTWEAVEHAGPGQYDEAYLDYFAEICRKAGEHELHLFVDFHQDVWSRMSGGDGAPGWTFDAVGLDFRRFPAAGAAHVMQAEYDYADPAPRQARYPQMSWSSNYLRPANGIMWTLFWAGAAIAPGATVDGESVQTFLQRHYLGAMTQVARRLADLPNVLGFDTLNEPNLGWIGRSLSHRRTAPTPDDPTVVRPGVVWSPLDGLAVARGRTVTLPVLRRDIATGEVSPAGETTINAAGVPIWQDGVQCPFEQAGIYSLEPGALVGQREDAFLAATSDEIFGGFFRDVARTIRAVRDDWSVFAEIEVFKAFVGERMPPDLPPRAVNANHWYDIATLGGKTFTPARGGPEAVAARRAHYAEQLGGYVAASADIPGGAPTLIGEFGVPFDLDEGASYARWAAGERGDGVWADQQLALGAMYDVMDALMLHSTQWNYTASNRNDARIGDGWNQEDLSIYSRDQRAGRPNDPDAGGRAVDGFSRPFARRIQGRLTSFRYRADDGAVEARIDADPAIDAPTELSLPDRRYGPGAKVEVSPAGAAEVAGPAGQVLRVRATRAGPLEIRVRPG